MLLKLPDFTAKKLRNPVVAEAASINGTGGTIMQVNKQFARSSRLNRINAVSGESKS